MKKWFFSLKRFTNAGMAKERTEWGKFFGSWTCLNHYLSVRIPFNSRLVPLMLIIHYATVIPIFLPQECLSSVTHLIIVLSFPLSRFFVKVTASGNRRPPTRGVLRGGPIVDRRLGQRFRFALLRTTMGRFFFPDAVTVRFARRVRGSRTKWSEPLEKKLSIRGSIPWPRRGIIQPCRHGH